MHTKFDGVVGAYGVYYRQLYLTMHLSQPGISAGTASGCKDWLGPTQIVRQSGSYSRSRPLPTAGADRA